MADAALPTAEPGASLQPAVGSGGPALTSPEALPTEAELAKQRARVVTRPSFNGALLVAEFATGVGAGEMKLTDLVCELADDIEKMWSGDMKQPEAMLFAQAQALQSIFVKTAREASRSQKLHQQDMLMRMALRAQSQCRMTLETLANIKNPPVIFARQANINQGGNQQVNNPPAAQPCPAPAGISEHIEADQSIRRPTP